MSDFNNLVERVIKQESGGNPNAVSPVGAAGLMQVMPATAASPGFGVAPLDWDKRFDPVENRRFGEQYLQAMLNRYDGDERRALAAYNWGAGNADKWNGDLASLPAETRGYITNITGGGNPRPSTPQEAQAAPQQGVQITQEDIDAAMAEPTWQDKASGAAAAMATPATMPVPRVSIQAGEAYKAPTDPVANAFSILQKLRAGRQ